MRYLKLATISVVYSISMIVLLAAIGAVFFGEKLSTREVVGVLLAIVALVLLIGRA
jgi:drug/metabolite transporter (DMT)-like permease